MDRKILHCDMNAFYASVELLDHPELREDAVAVAGDPALRHGIILAKNEKAKRCGIVTAETIQSALRKCPSLKLLPPHHEKYAAYSRKLNDIYLEYTDLVEPFSVDESWLDVTASETLFGPAEKIADEIRERIKAEYGLTLSVGVSYNKIFAKMGSDYRKPDATTVISRENYRALLWPLPVGTLFFVGRASESRLRGLGIRTIGDLAEADPGLLRRVFGMQGELLHRYANGNDTTPVKSFRDRAPVKSVGHGMTFRRNLLGTADLNLAASELSDKVCTRLRRYGMRAGGVKVEITEPDFRKTSRQMTLASPSNTSATIRKAALSLLRGNGFLGKPIRLLTVTAIKLSEEGAREQLTIFSLGVAGEEQQREEKDEKLERTMDKIRAKYGSSSIRYAHVLHNDIGIHDDLSIEERNPKEEAD